MTNGLIDPHDNYKKELQKLKYLERMSTMSPLAKQHLQTTPNYTQEDLNSVKFWNLIDPIIINGDMLQNINLYEQYLSEK